MPFPEHLLHTTRASEAHSPTVVYTMEGGWGCLVGENPTRNPPAFVGGSGVERRAPTNILGYRASVVVVVVVVGFAL